MITEELKGDPLWNSLEGIEDQSKAVEKYIAELEKKPKKAVTKKQAKDIISNTS